MDYDGTYTIHFMIINHVRRIVMRETNASKKKCSSYIFCINILFSCICNIARSNDSVHVPIIDFMFFFFV